jgi:hypothetical protein
MLRIEICGVKSSRRPRHTEVCSAKEEEEDDDDDLRVVLQADTLKELLFQNCVCV